MKLKWIHIAMFFCGLGCLSPSFAQDSNRFFFNEVHISVNRTLVEDNETEDGYGFGVGIYRYFQGHKVFSPGVGLEYNRTTQRRQTLADPNQITSYRDISYSINSFTIPVGFRLNMGSKVKFFVEMGGYFELVFLAKREAYLDSTVSGTPGLNNRIDDQVIVPSSAGLYAGLGARIPIRRMELIVKPEIKFPPGSQASNDDDLINRYAQLSLGLKF